MLDGASNDEGWGRQTMLPTCRSAPCRKSTVLTERVLGGVRLDRRARRSTSSPSRARTQLHGEGLYMGRPGGWQAKTFSTDGLLPAVDLDAARRRRRSPSINAGRHSRQAESGLGIDRRGDQAGQDVLLRRGRLHAPGPHDGALADAAGVRAADDGSLTYVGQYRSGLVNAPRRSQAHADADADVPRQLRSLLRHESERRRDRHQRAERRAPLHARRLDVRRPTT